MHDRPRDGCYNASCRHNVVSIPLLCIESCLLDDCTVACSDRLPSKALSDSCKLWAATALDQKFSKWCDPSTKPLTAIDRHRPSSPWDVVTPPTSAVIEDGQMRGHVDVIVLPHGHPTGRDLAGPSTVPEPAVGECRIPGPRWNVQKRE